ncbi:hypothetical protein RHGRI_033535 [Rhododendron griersonianum]|uniref:Uncharacterized protein n=1 Tax=Rhododendron griersonianum TaxID=479676 RepID=A0AAV6HY59_9ERIC|nr:hypothetical protein RHGRI_033535 [Rhododendron griersonianum]
MQWSNRLLARNNNGRQTNFQTSNDNEIAYKQTNFQTNLFLPRTMEGKLYKIENTYLFTPLQDDEDVFGVGGRVEGRSLRRSRRKRRR